MTIDVSLVPPGEVLALRELYRAEMGCRIILDSWHGRGWEMSPTGVPASSWRRAKAICSSVERFFMAQVSTSQAEILSKVAAPLDQESG